MQEAGLALQLLPKEVRKSYVVKHILTCVFNGFINVESDACLIRFGARLCTTRGKFPPSATLYLVAYVVLGYPLNVSRSTPVALVSPKSAIHARHWRAEFQVRSQSGL